MNAQNSLAASSDGLISPVVIFVLFVMASFLLCLFVGIRNDSVSEFFSAERGISKFQNTLALCGDWIPVTALLGNVSAIAVGGFDGMVIAASVTAGPAILLLLAGPLRSAGGFTLSGIMLRRFPGRATRIAGAVITVAMCIPMAIVQLTVAGDATAYVFGLDSEAASQVCTALNGMLIISFAAFGGMRGTSMIQLVKTVLVLTTLLALTWVVLRHENWDFGAIVEGAGQKSGDVHSYYSPGKLYGDSLEGKLDVVSLAVTAALGAAALPHIFMRLNVFTDGRSVRQGAVSATIILSLCAVLMATIGLASAAMVGDQPLTLRDQQGISALFLLSGSLNNGTVGEILVSLVSCAVFATALSTASGITLAVGSLVSDLYPSSRKYTEREEGKQVSLARWFIIGSGALSLFLAVKLHTWSVVSMTSFVFAIGASVVLPVIVYGLLWGGFNRTGLYATMYGSFAFCVFLQVFSPSVSGSPIALLPDRDFHWFPLHHISLVSVPAGFLIGWVASRLDGPLRARKGAASGARLKASA
ncbi:sodium:solute symporter family transporter [Streptomyces sp. NPDC055815]